MFFWDQFKCILVAGSTSYSFRVFLLENYLGNFFNQNFLEKKLLPISQRFCTWNVLSVNLVALAITFLLELRWNNIQPRAAHLSFFEKFAENCFFFCPKISRLLQFNDSVIVLMLVCSLTSSWRFFDSPVDACTCITLELVLQVFGEFFWSTFSAEEKVRNWSIQLLLTLLNFCCFSFFRKTLFTRSFKLQRRSLFTHYLLKAYGYRLLLICFSTLHVFHPLYWARNVNTWSCQSQKFDVPKICYLLFYTFSQILKKVRIFIMVKVTGI